MENIRDNARVVPTQRAARMRAPQQPLLPGYQFGAPDGILSSGSGEAPQEPRMVSVSAATRISIGCQTFYFCRDENGYKVSTREYQDWRLSNEDFEALVAALADLLPPLEAAEGKELASSCGAVNRGIGVSGVTCTLPAGHLGDHEGGGYGWLA